MTTRSPAWVVAGSTALGLDVGLQVCVCVWTMEEPREPQSDVHSTVYDPIYDPICHHFLLRVLEVLILSAHL